MVLFFILAALICAGAGVLILGGAAAAQKAGAGADPALAMHRRQLAEIDDLAARELMPTSEVRAAKAEAARRLLASAQRPVEAPAARPARGVVIGAAIGAPILAVAIYLAIGTPGLPDQPFQKRAAEWRADPTNASPAELAAAYAALAPQHKTDPEFMHNLALARLMAGEDAEAEQTARQALMLSPQNGELWSLLGRARMSDNGPVPAGAVGAFEEAVKYAPDDPFSNYYLGLASIQDGDVQGGLARWRGMLAKSPPADLAASLNAQIAQVEKTGKAPDFSPAPANAAQAAAAAGVDVNAMVSQLAARLKTSPNDPAGWAQLVRAYAVLGDKPKLDDALAQARKLFAGKPDVLKALDQAAVAPQ